MLLDSSRSLLAVAAALAVFGIALAGGAAPPLRTLDIGAKRPALYRPPEPSSAKAHAGRPPEGSRSDAGRPDGAGQRKPQPDGGKSEEKPEAAADVASQRPLVVFLHGMCALPEWECPVFRGVGERAWLLCPPGPAACQGTGAMWVGSQKTLSRRVDAATTALTRREQGIDSGRRALVGYSLGGPAALRIALASPGRYQRLMVVNASLQPSKALLDKAGIRRLALVAGEADGTAKKLRRTASRLAALGVDARYFSLGKVGHYFDASSEERMRASLEWLVSDWPAP